MILSGLTQRLPALGMQSSGGVTGGTSVKPQIYGPGSWTFVAPVAGLWAFRLWGGGGAGTNGTGGTGGAYAKKTVRLSLGSSVPIVVSHGVLAAFIYSDEYSDTATTASLSTGVVSAGDGPTNTNYAGVGYSASVASGGDINTPGGLPGSGPGGAYDGVSGYNIIYNTGSSTYPYSNTAGGGAPGDIYMFGGNGGDGASGGGVAQGKRGFTPGGGGGGCFGAGTYNAPGSGGDGMAIVTYEGP